MNTEFSIWKVARIPAPAPYARTAAASYSLPSTPNVNVESFSVGAAKSTAKTLEVLMSWKESPVAVVDEPSKTNAPY